MRLLLHENDIVVFGGYCVMLYAYSSTETLNSLYADYRAGRKVRTRPALPTSPTEKTPLHTRTVSAGNFK